MCRALGLDMGRPLEQAASLEGGWRQVADGGAISDSVTHSVTHSVTRLSIKALLSHGHLLSGCTPGLQSPGENKGAPWRTSLPCRFPGC